LSVLSGLFSGNARITTKSRWTPPNYRP